MNFKFFRKESLSPSCFILSFTMFVLSSCGNISSEVEGKLKELQSKTESLDSLINKEVDKVLTLDSLIEKESEKVKKLDTLIEKSTSQLDSFANKSMKLFEKK